MTSTHLNNNFVHPGFIQEAQDRLIEVENLNINTPKTQYNGIIQTDEKMVIMNQEISGMIQNTPDLQVKLENDPFRQSEKQEPKKVSLHEDMNRANSVQRQISNSKKKGFFDLFKECFSNNKKFDKIKIFFGPNPTQEAIYKHSSNMVRTTKYNAITWFPKSLLIQFFRAANIYFLIITILTAMPFSPKPPESQFLTFAAVLFFTMIKEGYEVKLLI